MEGVPVERVAVDVEGKRYVLVAIDYFTKWQEAYADQSAATTANCLVSQMFCCFGASEELHSDQRQNFEAGVFSLDLPLVPSGVPYGSPGVNKGHPYVRT